MGWCVLMASGHCRFLFVLLFIVRCSAVWVNDVGGYEDILIAVDSSTKIEDCSDFFSRFEELVSLFSRDLWRATDRRLHVASAYVLVDDVIANRCNITTAGTTQKWAVADIRVIDNGATMDRSSPWHPEALLSEISVRQPLGCGRAGDAIQVAPTVLSVLGAPSGGTSSESGPPSKTQIKEEIGRTLIASWARYRWGIFEDFPAGVNLPLESFPGKSTNNTARHPTKWCTNKTECESSNRSKSSGITPAISQAIAGRQELMCGKSASEMVKSHPDLSKAPSHPPEYDDFPLPLTTIFPKSRSPSVINPKHKPHSAVESSEPQEALEISETPSSSDFFKLPESPAPRRISEPPDFADSSRLPVSLGSSEISQTREASSRGTWLRRPSSPSLQGPEMTVKREERPEEDPPAKTKRDLKERALLVAGDFANGSTPHSIGAISPIDGVGDTSQDEVVTRIELLFSFEGDGVAIPPPQESAPPSPSSAPPALSTNQSVTWVPGGARGGGDDFQGLLMGIPRGSESPPATGVLRPPQIQFISSPRKAIVLALDLSASSMSQASVEWLRGGLLRWMFGVGEGVWVGILASYSNTSFPLSMGPLGPGPTSERQLKEHMALLPYQHEVDDNVYGGHYCVDCAVNEAEKMFIAAGIPLEAGALVLVVCDPRLTRAQMQVALNSPLPIHTLAMCPNAPLMVESLATTQGTWALSPASSELGMTEEVQIGQLVTKITSEALLWPKDRRLKTIHEESKLLREEDVERVGAYRRVVGSIDLERGGPLPRLVVLTSSSAAKVVELWSGKRRIEMTRDTTRRHWALVTVPGTLLTYSFKYLSSSLELPLTVGSGVYVSEEESGVKVTLRTNTRHYRPMNPITPFLKVWAEVTLDGRPIHDAHVSLSVTYLSAGVPATYSLTLLDDGSTEPDVIKGDSSYSRYLTWTPGTGRYILTATASSIPSTRVMDWGGGGERRSMKTGHFKEISSSLSVIVEMIVPGDIFPPSRVTDLAVTSLDQSLFNITWSAPGGDLDQGSAWRYELKMYTEMDALNEANFGSIGIDVYCLQGEEQAPLPAPALFQTPQSCVTSIPFSNLKWYFAIRAIDGANNTGRVSNIVFVDVSEPVTIGTSDGDDMRDDLQVVMMSTVMPNMTSSFVTDDVYDSWRVYGAALVGAVSLVMLAIAVFACLVCCRKARLRASKNPERPIYKIYVNNAYIQEEDGEIKVVSKEKPLTEKNSTQQWVNSLDKYSSVDAQPKEETTDTTVDVAESLHQSPAKFPKPVRFGVLTNGSIMRELPTSSSSSSSSNCKPSDEVTGEEFKYKDLSETISNSTSDGATASTSSAATEISTAEDVAAMKDPPPRPPPLKKNIQSLSYGYDMSYPPLGIPTLPSPPFFPPKRNMRHQEEYHSDDEGGFRPRFVPSPGPKKHLLPQFSSFRYLPPPSVAVDYPSAISAISKNLTVAGLPHGTVRSVKKRRHISFV